MFLPVLLCSCFWKVSELNQVLFTAQGPEKVEYPRGDLFAMNQENLLLRSNVAVPSLPKVPHVILSNGDRVVGTVLSGDLSRISFQSPYSERTFAIAVSSIAGVWFRGPDAEQPTVTNAYTWLSGTKQDSLLFLNRDRLGGLVERFGNGTLTFAQDRKPSQLIRFEQLHALVFDPSLVRAPKLRDDAIRVTTVDGSRVTFRTGTVIANVLTGKTVWGAELSIPNSSIVLMEWLKYTTEVDRSLHVEVQKQNSSAESVTKHQRSNGQELHLPGWGVIDRGYRIPASKELCFDLNKRVAKVCFYCGLEGRTTRLTRWEVLLDDVVVPDEMTLPLQPGEVRPVVLETKGAKRLRVRLPYHEDGAPPPAFLLVHPFFVP